MMQKDMSIEGLEEIPDGALKIREANKNKFNYTLSISDVSYFQYHRNNGVTKIGLVNEEGLAADVGKTNFLIRAAEGAMVLTDRMNNAYIKSVFNDTHVVSGQQYMPFFAQVDGEVAKIMNFIGIIIFSICMSLTMPIYLNHLVSEKE